MTPGRTSVPVNSGGETMVYTVDIGNGQVMDIEGPPGATPEQLQEAVAGHTASAPSDAPAEMQGGFSDELPYQVQNTLSPEDEAAYSQMLRTADAGTLRQFLASKGKESPAGELEKYVVERDKAQAAGIPLNYDVTYQAPDVSQMADTGAAAAGIRGAVDSLTLGAGQKAKSLVDAVKAQMGGSEQSFMQDWSAAADTAQGLEQNDQEEHPWARGAGQLLGGLALPSGMEGLGLSVGRDVLRAGGSMADARAAIRVAVRNRMGAVGGGYGAAHGVLSADTPGEAITGGLTEGAIGAAAGLGMGALAPGRAASAAQTEGQRVAAAAGRQGVDVLPADVGGPTIRRLTAAAAQAPISAAPVINGAQRAVEQTQGVRDRFANLIGNVLNPEAAGERARDGANAMITRTGGRANTLYRNAEAGSAGVAVTPTQASATLARNIRELSDTPGGAEGLARLQGLQDAFSNGNFSVEGVRRMRSALRDEFAGAGLRGTDIERRVNQVADAANDDVINSLTAAGRPAVARQFQVADRYWRNRIRTIDDTLAPIIGKDGDASGEAIVRNLQSSMKGNNQRFARFLSAIPDDARGDVRASLIGRLGRANKGAQNDEGTGFSLQTFLSNWDDIGETAKGHLFGPESRAAFNDLATIASGARETAGYANRSNTAGGIWGNIGALTGLGAVSPVTAISALVGQYGGGRLLASPRMTRWLTRAPNNVAGGPAYVERLSRIARAEPAIANEVLQLQRRLTDAFSSAPTRMAAQEAPNEVAEGQGNTGEQQSQQQGFEP